MRAIWSGAITFGLVNVPVKLYSATEDHDVELHQVHEKDGGRIRYERRCEVCGKVVAYEDIDRAYVGGDETVVLTKDELAAIPQEHDRDIEVLSFVPNDQLDPIMFERSYYLRPEGKSSKAYVLLRRTLEGTDRTAIVQFAMRQKTRLAALRVRDDVLVLQTMLWPDEVRDAEFAAPAAGDRISAKELELSAALVKSFAGDFKAEDFRDEYQEQLRTLVEAKLEQGDSLDTDATFGEAAEGEDAEVIDLMEALRKSVARSRSAKRGSSGKTAPSGGTSGTGGHKKAASGTSAKKASGAKKSARTASGRKKAAS